MHVSRKADYALRAMSYLAGQAGRRVLIAEVAREMSIPQAFLSKIMKQMVEAGLVDSQPGRGGGYELTRASGSITFREIVEAVEGPWTLVPCQSEDDEGCQVIDTCLQASIWHEIQGQMLELLDGYTLERVLARQQADRIVSLRSAAV